MTLTVNEGQKATKIAEARYQKASKKHKGIILDEFIALTGMALFSMCTPHLFKRSKRCVVQEGANDCNTV